MADTSTSARTNYVRFEKTKEEVQAHFNLIKFDANIVTKDVNGETLLAFLPNENSDDGGFMGWLNPDIPDREDQPEAFASLAQALGVSEDDLDGVEEFEFSWEDHVMPLVTPGEVLVVQKVGAEKLRYLFGYSEAYFKKPDGSVKIVSIILDDIYEKAKEKFGVKSITEATY